MASVPATSSVVATSAHASRTWVGPLRTAESGAKRVVTDKVQGLPVPEREAYITRAELAALMGISPKSVDRLVKQGLPSVTWGLRTRRFKASVALQWARAQDGGPNERSAA